MKRILLLEDDTALGQGIRLALARDGVEAELCAAASQARSLLPDADFDLLILDINLPDGSGLDLLQELRRRQIKTPAILLTANDLETGTPGETGTPRTPPPEQDNGRQSTKALPAAACRKTSFFAS